MTRPALRARLGQGLALIALGLGVMGCRDRIHQPCSRASDCGINVIRQCDLSYKDGDQKGECTLENCGRGDCPSEAVCVKVYPTEFISRVCDPEREDRVGEDDEEPLDDCDPHEVCLPEGVCAAEIGARTSCRLRCSNNGDCRSGYVCKRTGFDGTHLAPDPDDPDNRDTEKICVPDR